MLEKFQKEQKSISLYEGCMKVESLNFIGNTGNLLSKMTNVKNLRNDKTMKIGKFKLYKRHVCLNLNKRVEVLSIAEKILPYSMHNEKLRKIRLLKIGDRKQWKMIKNEVEALKSQIKKEVEICTRSEGRI
jgi:hypothetical protein